ncbi:hypothetical protein IMY05_C4459000100 [Salix suchowensis]|nr:hypothetical protein IMY05_C4459000100 [Salix suchowensis]
MEPTGRSLWYIISARQALIPTVEFELPELVSAFIVTETRPFEWRSEICGDYLMAQSTASTASPPSGLFPKRRPVWEGSTVTLPSQPSTPQTPNRLPRTAEVQRDIQVAEGATSKAKPTIIDLLLTPPPSNLKGKGKGKRKFEESEDALGEGSPTPTKRTRDDRDNDLEQVESALIPLALNVPLAPREGGEVMMRPSAPEDHRIGIQEGAGSNNTGVPIADAEVRPPRHSASYHSCELLTPPGQPVFRPSHQSRLLIAPGAIRIPGREIQRNLRRVTSPHRTTLVSDGQTQTRGRPSAGN